MLHVCIQPPAFSQRVNYGRMKPTASICGPLTPSSFLDDCNRTAKKNWDAAQKHCQGIDGEAHLVKINDADEHNFVKDRAAGNSVWIGCKQQPQTKAASTRTSRDWNWIDGTFCSTEGSSSDVYTA